MDLSTTYLGFELEHPLMPGASPLAADTDSVKRLVEAGAPAIVMHSLFEEQILREAKATLEAMDTPAESSPEALSYFPNPEEFRLGPGEYLDQIQRIKKVAGVPVIASLNGATPGGWLGYAQKMVAAGADALELNIYFLPTDPRETAQEIEERMVEMVRDVKQTVPVPVAVKLSRSFSALPNLATRLVAAGADGLVLFNRFYQPDIDIEALEVTRTLALSRSAELLPRLRWLAVLSGRIDASLAVTGGVHTVTDAIKAIMTGADGVQIVSALLQNGPGHLATLRRELNDWLERHEYESLAQARGSMNLARTPDPGAYERANYMHILSSWRR